MSDARDAQAIADLIIAATLELRLDGMARGDLTEGDVVNDCHADSGGCSWASSNQPLREIGRGSVGPRRQAIAKAV